MSAEDSIDNLRTINFKDLNSECSKNNLNFRLDDYTKRRFDMTVKTSFLLLTQPISLAISRETKLDCLNSLKDVKKVFDSLYLITKDSKYKNYIDGINEIISNGKLR